METKWIAIMVAVVFLGMFVGIGFSEYNNNQCKIAAIDKGLTAEDIRLLCR